MIDAVHIGRDEVIVFKGTSVNKVDIEEFGVVDHTLNIEVIDPPDVGEEIPKREGSERMASIACGFSIRENKDSHRVGRVLRATRQKINRWARRN